MYYRKEAEGQQKRIDRYIEQGKPDADVRKQKEVRFSLSAGIRRVTCDDFCWFVFFVCAFT